MERGENIEDAFLVTSAFVQGYRGTDDNYKIIATGSYSIDYDNPIASKKYTHTDGSTQNMHNVFVINVDGGGTVYTSNNWRDREAKLNDAIRVFGR